MNIERAVRQFALILSAIGCALPLCMNTAQAQNYPDKPIIIISAFAPGGTIDFLGRLMMQKITQNTG